MSDSADPPADAGRVDAPGASAPGPADSDADVADSLQALADAETLAEAETLAGVETPAADETDDSHTQRLADAVRAVAEQQQQQERHALDGDPATVLDGAQDAGADNGVDVDATADDAADGLDDADSPFDPTLFANLSALARIQADDDAPLDGDGHGELAELLREPALTREQVQEFVKHFGAADRAGGGDGAGQAPDGHGADDGSAHGPGDGDGEDEGEDDGEEDDAGALENKADDDYLGPKIVEEGGKRKRKRNRAVLSCTECHRRSWCIKRGVPSMCRMETPALPPRKKRRPRPANDVPIDYELSLRVQALESLMRAGPAMDADAASTVAMETIMHATRAANSGQPEAVNALAQLTSASAGMGVGGMTQEAQNSLLVDVLQQLSAASMARPVSGNDDSPSYVEMRDTWSTVPAAPVDSLAAVELAYNADASSSKVNVATPGFLEDGKVFVPPSVRHVEKLLRADTSLLEPVPVEGHAGFLDLGTRFAYGKDSAAYKTERISAVQAASPLGALRLAATFVARFPATPLARTIYVPDPTTDEDQAALRDVGLDVKFYRYLDPKTGGIDWTGLNDDLAAASPRSAVLLHVSGSIPTGAELTSPQWRLMSAILQERQLIPLVVMAFQGLTSGDTDRDAQPVRFMVHDSVPVVLAQSFEAMTGLYTDSPAIVSVVTRSTADRDRVDSQLRAIARSSYSRPSAWGARIMHALMADDRTYNAWLAEIKAMSVRLRSVKDMLFSTIAHKLKTPGSWLHIKRAGGMHSTTLLPTPQVEALAAKRHVHLFADGTFSLSCLDRPKLDALARGVDSVVREAIREAEEQAAQMAAMEAALAAAREQHAREEAEAAAAAARAEEEAAREEDAAQLEASIRSAMEAQRLAEEDERRREEETKLLEEQLRKAQERAEIQRRAEQIIAMI